MQLTSTMIFLFTWVGLAWGIVAYAIHKIMKNGVCHTTILASLITPLTTFLLVALLQDGDLSIRSLFPYHMLSYGGDSLSYLAQSKMLLNFKPTEIQYLPGFAAFITPIVFISTQLGGDDTIINLALWGANYFVIFPLIFLLLYHSILNVMKIKSTNVRTAIYSAIFFATIILFIEIPPDFMIDRNVHTASHRILGLVVVYEPYYYFLFSFLLYLVSHIENANDGWLIGLTTAFSVLVTERSILWSAPLITYYFSILVYKNISIKRAMLTFCMSMLLILLFLVAYNFLFYENPFHNARESYWINRCLHWSNMISTLYPGIDSQCPSRMSIGYILHNFNRIANDYWLGPFYIFVLILLFVNKETRLIASLLAAISVLNVITQLSYINPQTFIKYNSILIWPCILAITMLIFEYQQCKIQISRVK